jgi:hypothetical protein
LIEYYKHNDSAKTIGQIRHRLAVMGDLKQDSGSNLYDEELIMVMRFQKKETDTKPTKYFRPGSATNEHTNKKYISTIMVNMERCRWIDLSLHKSLNI